MSKRSFTEIMKDMDELDKHVFKAPNPESGWITTTTITLFNEEKGMKKEDLKVGMTIENKSRGMFRRVLFIGDINYFYSFEAHNDRGESIDDFNYLQCWEPVVEKTKVKVYNHIYFVDNGTKDAYIVESGRTHASWKEWNNNNNNNNIDRKLIKTFVEEFEVD